MKIVYESDNRDGNANNEVKKNWVLVEPYFDREMNLAGFNGYLELEEGGLHSGDRICLHNDPTPNTAEKIYGVFAEETPFCFIVKIPYVSYDTNTKMKETRYYKKCISKSTLFASQNIRMEWEEKRKEELEKITMPKLEMLEKLN